MSVTIFTKWQHVQYYTAVEQSCKMSNLLHREKIKKISLPAKVPNLLAFGADISLISLTLCNFEVECRRQKAKSQAQKGPLEDCLVFRQPRYLISPQQMVSRNENIALNRAPQKSGPEGPLNCLCLVFP